MNTLLPFRNGFFPTLSFVVALIFGPAATAVEQAASSGMIQGRILNPRTGEYVENARVTVEGTLLQAFTDATGHYRITQVPAGPVTVKAFYTGLAEQSAQLDVAPGAVVRHDISLGEPAGTAGRTDVVTLSTYVVNATREMSGAAIAINEQRVAPNMKTVVAADEFGTVQENDVGEFLKFVPGMTINYVGGGVRTISMNGVPADNVPITVGGFSLASVGANQTERAVELDQISMNNIARVEAIYTPTPESPGSALAGSVNLVPRSAFERAKPLLTWSAAIVMRDTEKDFDRTPGPFYEPRRKIFPSFDLSYVRPVNERFGFTVSAGSNSMYMPQTLIAHTWRGVRSSTNGTTFPDTTPGNPYLTDLHVRDGTKVVDRHSFASTVDYKLSPNDRLSFSFTFGRSRQKFHNRTLQFTINRVNPGDFTPTWTHGAPGQGQIALSQGGRDKIGDTIMPTLTWRHDGPVWRIEAGAALSRATNRFRDFDQGLANPVIAQRTGVTVHFDDIFYLRPNQVTVTDGVTGAAVNPYQLSSYNLASLKTNGTGNDALDQRRTVNLSAQRQFMAGRVPFTLKAGLDVNEAMREWRGGLATWTFLGADGRAGTADDNAGGFVDASFSQRVAPYGFPRVEWIHTGKVVDHFRAHPEQFTVQDAELYRWRVTQSKHAEELISAAYFRGDVDFFERRLRLVGGLRVEQTNIRGEGELLDATRNFQRDASGKVIAGSNGSPLLIDPAGSLAALQRTNIDRGLVAKKEYLRWFPSFNASFELRPNLLARVGHFWSVGRPSFVQYAGSLTLPDVDRPPAANNRISVNNAGIKAWSAKTTKIALEYYFKGVGLFSVGAFQRDIENFFGSTTFLASPEFLGIYGLDAADYGAYDVATQYNIPGTVRMTGVDVNYKQALTFLPHWARGVQVFANLSSQRSTGGIDAFSGFRTGFVPRSYNWGISLSREKYRLRANWSYRGRQRRSEVTGRSIEPGTYQWGAKQLKIDLGAEYSIRPRLTLFANLSNIHDANDDTEYVGPSTPEHAQLYLRENYGGLWTFGVKGSF